MHSDSIKTFLKLSKPSAVLMYLLETNKLDSEIAQLTLVEQDKKNHPEGNVFIHTCMVVDKAAAIAERENLSNTDNAILRLAALTHDFGKITNTQIHTDGRITAWGHPEAGVLPAKQFLQVSKVNPNIIAQILPLVDLHMAWVGFYTPDITSKSVRKLIRKLEPSNLTMLKHVVEADMSGRGGKYYNQGVPQRMLDIIEVANHLYDPVDAYPEHYVSGDDIMRTLNIAPSPLLGKVKAALYKAQLEGKFYDKETGIQFLKNNIVIT